MWIRGVRAWQLRIQGRLAIKLQMSRRLLLRQASAAAGRKGTASCREPAPQRFSSTGTRSRGLKPGVMQAAQTLKP